MMLTIVSTTLLQFHHHDLSGNTFITLSFFGELQLGVNSSVHDCNHCNHCGENATPEGMNNTENSCDCSLRIDETLKVITDDSWLHAAVTSLLFYCDLSLSGPTNEEYSTTIEGNRKPALLPEKIIGKSMSLRAPPSQHCIG